MKNKLLISSVFLLFTMACEKIKYAVDNPIAGLPTKVLMHRGNGFNTDYVQNTFQAAAYGLSVLDGIELDIQYSKDGTLWLDHNNEVHDCEGNLVGCFQDLTDQEILDAAICDSVVRYHKLEPVFQLMSIEFPESWISLDVKGQYCNITSIPSVMRKMARSVLDLTAKYEMTGQVLVESNSVAFLEELNNQELVGQTVVSLGDIDKGLADAAYTKSRGISLKYGIEELNDDVVELIHRKGYGLIVWVVNEPEDIAKVWTSHPDFIQTDRADFKDFIPENR